MKKRLRYALVGDGQSPHLLKWGRALAPLVDLWVCSSRSFSSDWEDFVPENRRFALHAKSNHGGDNTALLLQVPRLARWLRRVDADWINPHYLTSHGTLVLLAHHLLRLRGRVVASAWGSDILITPQRNIIYRKLTEWIVHNSTLFTSDSQYMTQTMKNLGARKVLTFPFGLEVMPSVERQPKNPWLFYANRGLEPIYQPLRVLEFFLMIVRNFPEAQLVIANSGSQEKIMRQWVLQQNLQKSIKFVGRLTAIEQKKWYELSQWYISLPQSDSVAVSVLEAMAHGCIPLLSNLPANRELVMSLKNGWILEDCLQESEIKYTLSTLLLQANEISQNNYKWISENGLFTPAINRLVEELQLN